ncbi:TlpA family protein disulfide reductase [Flavobacterium zhairuonense]|uniref:TlpA family protein disulfide reductase n=1 Tax=Flavobacterium zhairuonense TaxID=2493631 RepID=UPI00104EF940|nr:TlpA disulfide reductase family protein [Flavobacterium zhairuonense]KAF2507711.1 TlpA family protein disulfide reductase [Flavobacterium zhairuonense]
MLKKIVIICTLFISGLIYCQVKVIMHGKVVVKKNIKDTISFIPGLFLDEKYYENNFLSSPIIQNEFHLKFSVHYPQMYVISLTSERNSGKLRFDYCFIDSTTTEISFDSDYRIKKSNGVTNKEFINRFIPYIFQDKKESFHFYSFDESLDERLYDYIKEYPDSYVALWFLIGRFNKEGYTELYEKSLQSFSQKIKNDILWKKINEEFSGIMIKINLKFPEIILKNIDLTTERLEIPKAEYTLIDFWFSRCRPCLEEMPKWINLYERYNSVGLNIIGISTDKTENIETYWQKRIVEKKIPWKNYLDENAVFASREKITAFPTNYLLNSKGEVIQKNIRPQELEKLLIDSYKIKKQFDNYDRRITVPISTF